MKTRKRNSASSQLIECAAYVWRRSYMLFCLCKNFNYMRIPFSFFLVNRTPAFKAIISIWYCIKRCGKISLLLYRREKEEERSFNNKQCTAQTHWIVFSKYYKCHEHSGTLEWKTVENITAIDKLIQIFISYVLETKWEQANTNHWHFELAIVWHQIGFRTILWVVFRPCSPRTPFQH